MYRLPSIILRLAAGTLLGIVFFILTAGSLAPGGAPDVTATVLIVVLPLLIGQLAAWITLGFWSRVVWRRLERTASPAESDLPEYEWERTVKHGLRVLLGPLASPWSMNSRLRSFVGLWAGVLLDARSRDSWCWRFYSLAVGEPVVDRERIARMGELLLETDPLSEEALQVGLKVFRLLPERTELTRKLALETLPELSEASQIGGRELLSEIRAAAYLSHPDLRPRLLPRLTERFLEVQRRDDLAGRVYLDAYRSGLHKFGLTREMAAIASILERDGREPELAEALVEALKESGEDIARNVPGPEPEITTPGTETDAAAPSTGDDAEMVEKQWPGSDVSWGREPEME
ncbi:MAG TPA: hypothetical protein ENI92_02750, partial [Bacteroidetes bacterium]|nr:hypothetical protein [Bacteroidota bacterium]